MTPPALQRYQQFIGGQWIEASSGECFESFNPYTGEPWALIPRGGPADAAAAIEAAQRALKGPWASSTATERGAMLRRLADAVGEEAQDLAAIEVRDNGKLYAEMSLQTRYLQQWYHYFAGLADKIEGAVLPVDKPGHLTFTRHEPVGVVVAIVPWNSPLLLTAWKLAPALAAGNTVVVKPSEFTSASILEFAKIVEKVGLPPGVFNVVTGYGREIGPTLTEHPAVAKIAFTGSDQTGKAIYRSAADGLKRVSLELGGKSANIVFADADLDAAVMGAVSGIFAASGQTCIAGSRLLVERRVHDRVVGELVKVASGAHLGDPMLPGTNVGPVTNPQQLDKILKYIGIGRADGADIAFGGGRPITPECARGWFVEPTIFTGVHNGMRVARDEIFGPVLSIIPFDDEDEAIAIANDSPFGLAAGVWTSDIARAIRVPEHLEVGTVWVNTYRAMSFMAPFGGYKQSGLGREGGQRMIHEYLNTKTTWMSINKNVANPFVQR